LSGIFVRGEGAVSPAGWGVPALRDAIARGEPLPVKEMARPGWTGPLMVRTVPPASPRPAFVSHARLRRASPISHYAVAAALEALGAEAAGVANGALRLGIVMCVMSGCVNYSRRFYDETLKNPATASPLVFPETVFNAPWSHLAALLGTPSINYTMVGDPGTMLQGLALAGDWLITEQVDGCLVIGAEEIDWLTADAVRMFTSKAQVSEGAGALYLRREPSPTVPVELKAVTDSYLFCRNQSRAQAAQKARAALCADGAHLLCDGLQAVPRMDRDEAAAWRDCPGARVSVKKTLGEGLMAAAAWQCIAAVDALRQGQFANASVSVVGCNQQAIAAQFGRLAA